MFWSILCKIWIVMFKVKVTVMVQLFIGCLSSLYSLDHWSVGPFLSGFKHAVVKPLLRKPTLDHNNLKTYRPVSNLSFLPKVIEKMILQQLFAFLNSHDLLCPSQSAYCPCRSTETALLKISNDILHALDSGDVTVLTLLDLCFAFNTIDHYILLHRPWSLFSISGTVLSWFESYLTGRTQTLTVNNQSSRPVDVSFGVPHGSVLGPILFILLCTSLLFEWNPFCFQSVFRWWHTTTSPLSSWLDTCHCPDHTDLHLWREDTDDTKLKLKTEALLIK